tara:strand:- start:22 stop:159 length:138 start_codon:yes stop_codon:yes gene_type:complete
MKHPSDENQGRWERIRLSEKVADVLFAVTIGVLLAGWLVMWWSSP